MHIRLHTKAQNSAGERVRIALGLKGLPYQYMAISSLDSKEYRALNPFGLMPALEIEGKIITESMAMLEAIEEIAPEPPLLPEEIVERAKVRAFAQTIIADIHPIGTGRVRNYLIEKFGASEEQGLEWNRHWIALAFEGLEKTMQRRAEQTPFCFGDAPGMAEVCLVPQMRNARRFGSDLEPYPLLNAIDERCREIEAFKWAEPEAQSDWVAPH